MLKESLRNSKVLCKLLLLVLAIYSLLRIIFYGMNSNSFHDVGVSEFFGGILFDLSTIAMINVPIFLIALLPFKFVETKGYQTFYKLIFTLVNVIGVLPNIIDFEFFQFTRKRATIDLIDLMSYGNDGSNLLPALLKDYWYLFLSGVVVVVLIYRLVSKIHSHRRDEQQYYFLRHLIVLIVVSGVSVVMMRGGFQLRPLGIVDASKYGAGANTNIVLNTTFTMLKSIGFAELEQQNYMNREDARKIVQPIKQFPKDLENDKNNVIVFILESFSAEFVGGVSGLKSETPFLDSLISEGLVFDRHFANGTRSIEGLPNILASIPTLSHISYISSAYSGNQIHSLGEVLNKQGYSTSFYHGATNGSMNFNGFCAVAGIDKYYGRKEYGNEKDYNGSWGIHDGEFFNYFFENLKKEKKPFFTSIFSLSSHQPYVISDGYENWYLDAPSPMHRSIQYVDKELEILFEKMKKQDWFENTLFVFTADHSYSSTLPYYSSELGRYNVPLIFYHPQGKLKGRDSSITQQLDIFPSIIDFLGIDEEFYSFGNSVFDTTASRYHISYLSGIYQYSTNEWTVLFDGDNATHLYQNKKDRLLHKNVIEKYPDVSQQMENKVKALIQVYNDDLIHNNTFVRKEENNE